ncbi:MAG: hypothetical protein AAGB93_15375 [Planctomycetota bacterium]
MLRIALLACLVASACAAPGYSSDPRDYPVTMRPEIAGVHGTPGHLPGDRTAFVAIWNQDGRELISGVYDLGRRQFVEDSLMLLGRLPEEFNRGDEGDFERSIGEQECSFLLRCADPTVRGNFLRAQSPTNRGVGLGQEQALVAFGGLVSLLTQRDGSGPRSGVVDPCSPPIRQDYCTWSPELFPIACCKHDACYLACETTGRSQSECDAQFLSDMADEASIWTAPFVPIYYAAVRAFGSTVFRCG